MDRFRMENPTKIGDLGEPSFKETPIYDLYDIYIYIIRIYFLDTVNGRKS